MAIRSNVISVNAAGTLDGLFRERVRRTPEAIAYRRFERGADAWQEYTWTAMAAEVSRWQHALRAEHLEQGDRVALLLRNGIEWVTFEQAALGLGLVVVPLYVEDRPDNIAYIVRDAGVKLLLLQDATHWHRLRDALEGIESLRRIWLLHTRSAAGEEHAGTRSVNEVLPERAGALRERGGDPHRLATIVYTSGTTGRPKGVMLSHRNILAVAHGALEVLDVFESDVLLSFLPLSHSFERTCGYYLPMMAGASVAFARSVQQLAEDIRTIRPTALISVPRVFERIYDRIQQQARGSLPARLLLRLTVHCGWRRFLVRQRRAWPGPALLLWPLLDPLVARRVRERLGGRLRLAVSGGAALPPAVARLFIGLGTDVLQGYGMTETSPVVSANTLEQNRPESVGRPLPGIVVRIATGEELLVKGPCVMLGYWNNHSATGETIDAEGWLHTGDRAHIDDHGFITITGRIKDILVMSNGEKVSPVDMESAITLDPLFDQAMLVGEGRAYLAALVVINSDHWFGLARQHRLDPFDAASLRDRRLQHDLVARVGRLLHDFPGYAKVRRVAALLEPWTIDNGLVTPTLKTKRAAVMQRYAQAIGRLYD